MTADAMESRALSGADAKARLAKRHIMEPPADVKAAVELASAAADEGSGEGAHFLALLSAWGIGVPQDWQAAIGHLKRAGDLGHVLAKATLALTEGEPQIAALLTPGGGLLAPNPQAAPPRLKCVSQNPRIFIVERFLPAAACDWLMARAEPHLQRAQVYKPVDGIWTDPGRTNSECRIDTAGSDLILMAIQQRIGAIAGIPVAGMEACSLLHYASGEEFRPHYDYFDVSTPERASTVERDSQRALTFLAYLNDGFGDGETAFPKRDWKYKGNRGDALFFWNVGRDGAPDTQTLHAGLPVSSGEKWLLSQWVRARAALR